jgi:hypothetical protein
LTWCSGTAKVGYCDGTEEDVPFGPWEYTAYMEGQILCQDIEAGARKAIMTTQEAEK